MATQESPNKELLECPVCYQECVHPVRLPCDHIFCYLCVKGVVTRARSCALCRRPVPVSYLENPEMVDKTDLELEQSSHADDDIQWFYQARRRGWWVYEKRIATEIEQRYQKDPKAVFDLQIAGFLYTIDFENMEQYRKDDRNVSRAIKRDHIKHVKEVQGKAGIRLANASRTVEGGSPTDSSTAVTANSTQGNESESLSRGSQSSVPRQETNRSTNNSTSRGRSQPVDLTQLVSEMNLFDNVNNSDEEPESLV